MRKTTMVAALATTAAATAISVSIASCGQDSAAHHDGTKSDHSGSSGGGGASKAKEQPMKMGTTVQETVGDVRVGVMMMGPETFFVSSGTKLRKHTPTKRDNAHLMVTLADAKSGLRLPDATVTLRLTGPGGKVAYDGPLYPMIGRGMGMHYGENVAFGAPGEYRAALVTSPPRIGRHRTVAKAWNKTIRIAPKFRWDGREASKVG